MRLKKLEIEGFKSYAQRVTITDFDKSFNAITGYNGTGKSNVLDAICFVLGISDIKTVRAAHLSDLIYKHGQAGICKASVTATFDNSEGLCIKEYKGKDVVIRRQVVLNGRNIYTVNGNNVPQTRVQDMLRGVSMNVNNPHFLIMQGRIGKVLSMSPSEIVAMVEEAVGVRMYEAKKNNCLRTIEKKQIKLNEITTILEEKVEPMIARLTAEREGFLRYERVNAEYSKLEKKITVYSYIQTEKSINIYLEQAAEKEQQVATLNADMDECREQVETLSKEVTELKRSKETALGSEKAAVDKELKALRTTKMEAESAVDEAQREVKTEQDSEKGMLASLKKQEKDLDNLKTRLADADQKIGDEVAAMEAAQADLEKAQKQQSAVQRNMVTDENGEEILVNDLLMNYTSKCTTLETEHTKCTQRIAQIDTRLGTLRKEIAAKKSINSDGLLADKQRQTERIAQLKAAIGNLDFDTTREAQLNKQAQSLNVEINRRKSEVHDFLNRRENAFLRFDHNARPNVDYDPRDLYGPLYGLFKVKDKKFYRAVEIAVGGALNNIVVRTNQIAQNFINKKWALERRTYIPLNDVKGNWVTEQRLAEVRKVCHGEVYPLQDIIEFAPELEHAMKYVFGSRLICEDRVDATKIAYTCKIKAITLIGEEINPGGLASGGGNYRGESRFEGISRMNALQAEITELEAKMNQVRTEMKALQTKSSEHSRLTEDLSIAENALKMVESQLKQSVAHMLQAELEKLEEERREKAEMKEKLAAEIPDLKKKITELEKNMKNQAAYMDAQLKEAKELEKSARARLKKYDATAKKEQLDKMKEDITLMEDAITQYKEDIEGKRAQIAEMKAKIEGLKAELEVASQAVADKEKVLDECQSKLDAQDSEIRDKNTEIATIKKQILELETQRDTVAKGVEEDRNQSKACKARVQQLEKQLPYLRQDKNLFNTPNSDYDFSNFNYEEATAKKAELEEEKKTLGQNINKEAGRLLDENEGTANDLRRKWQQIQDDKAQLLKTIENLDKRKRVEMKEAYVMVNEKFGAIFSTLLPGAQAKLEPAPGATIDNLDKGLVFKVGFNNLWKEQLSELSGGQRSLVALSLILSLLHYKPAPLYILDEVDAALDVSHTANIGVLIKKHFSNAQFIVVSLKPGMFNNANAIYRTKLLDGVSTISRVQSDTADEA
uniref:Structural maintenance of chromosomes protein n=1 Tax=Panagrellus redivivus TaxID=6233 RepID=A0A7E4ZVI2_PANRE